MQIKKETIMLTSEKNCYSIVIYWVSSRVGWQLLSDSLWTQNEKWFSLLITWFFFMGMNTMKEFYLIHSPSPDHQGTSMGRSQYL